MARQTFDGAALFGASISAIAGMFALAFIGTFAIFLFPMILPPVKTVGVAVRELAAVATGIYLVSSIFRLLARRRRGYREDEAVSSPAARHIQSVLVATSLVIAAMIVGYSGLWNHRLASREYAHSKSCYARLEAAERLPRFSGMFAPGYFEFHAQTYRGVAQEHGAMLGMPTLAIDGDLSDAAARQIAAYGSDSQGLLNDVLRCVNDD